MNSIDKDLVNTIRFEQAAPQHEAIIFKWINSPHMKPFWDNSQAHRDDIQNFIHGRKQIYFYGTTKYWVAYVGSEPFAFLLTDELLDSQEDLTELHKAHLSKSGHTITLDFGIGNTEFLGKGLAAPTLQKFAQFYRTVIDSLADTFFIDPDENNPRTLHVYKKAGFTLVGEFAMMSGAFEGKQTHLLVMKF